MASSTRKEFLSSLESEFGFLGRIGKSTSLFTIRDRIRVYVRYSKLHERGATFYGLREEDLALMEGFPSFIAFLWEGQKKPLLVPYEQFASVFQAVEPSRDGQYKTHIYPSEEGTDLHIVRAGRFGVDSYFGLDALRASVSEENKEFGSNFSHSQMQTLVGAIGKLTGHGIYIPLSDRSALDWEIVERFNIANDIPSTGRYGPTSTLSFIDVLWFNSNNHSLAAAFEIEHSTPIYSGLLRFNDVHIDFKIPRAGIVALSERRERFISQINRRTFTASGLNDICLFYSYEDIYRWYQRLKVEQNN
jgi:hypothetical protein